MRSWLLLWALLIPILGIGQDQIKRVEYFYDVDPGFGNGTAISFTPDTEVEINTSLDLTGVQPGLHVAYMRAENDSGWSMTFNRPFLMIGGSAAPNVVALEYYIDTDPGFGNGTTVATTSAQSTSEALTIDLNGISPGLHTLYLRAKNENNAWSQVLNRAFSVTGDAGVSLIDRIEYFVDTDPGYGNGTAVDLTDGAVTNDQIDLDLSGVAPGIRIIHLRARNTNGVWSLNFTRPFLQIGQGAAPNAIEVEYFFDDDPGFGMANPLDIVDGEIVAEDLTFDLTGLTDGLHLVYVRAKNENGTWSQTFTRPFIMVGGEAQPNLTGMEYSIDSDPGFGNGVFLPLDNVPVDVDTFIVGLSDTLATGLHLLYLRAQSESGVWSQTFTRPFLKSGSAVEADIIGIEYFFDQDPGFDQGNFVTADSAAKAIEIGSVYDLTGLSNGVHLVYTRAKDANGMWSETFARPFIVTGKKAIEDVVEIEYFIDSIGQWGTGRNFQFNPKALIDTSFIADVSGYAAGDHKIYFRAKSSTGAWSHYIEESFCIGPGARFASDTVCFMNFTTFMNTSTATTDSTQYRWDYDVDGIIDDSTEFGIQWHYGATGTYDAQIIAWNDSGCVDTAIYKVEVDSIGDIMGTVFTDQGPVVAGGVEIFRFRPLKGKWTRVDSIALDSMGQYHLRNVKAGDYIIRAKGDTSLYGEYITTYFDSTYKWVSADIITTLCDTVIDIGLLEASFVFGDGTISGTITQEIEVINLKTNKTTKVLGDPIPGIDVSLEQVPGGVVAAQTTTDEDGLYQFDNLPPTGFQIYVDIPGLGMEETYQVVVTEQDTVFDELDFIVDSTAIYIDFDSTAVDPGDTTGDGGGKVVTVPGDTDPTDTTYIGNNPLDTTVIESVGEIANRVAHLKLYPNPFQNNITLEIDLKDADVVGMRLTDVLGREVDVLTPSLLTAGRHNLSLSISEAHALGVYQLQLRVGDAFLNKSLVRTR